VIGDMTETPPQDDRAVMTTPAGPRYSRPAMDGLQHAGVATEIGPPDTERVTFRAVSIAVHDCPDVKVLRELARVTALGGWLVLDVLNAPGVTRDVELMLAECGFRVRDVCGDHKGTPLARGSARAIFIARRVLLRGC
jgi:hypothetical protein